MSIVGAQILGQLMDNLWSGANVSFGYTTNASVSITKFGANNTVTLSSPLVKDSKGNTVTSYTIMYSQYPLTQILDQADLLNQTKEVDFELTGSNDPFTMDVTIDSADTSKRYYLFVIPKDSTKTIWQLSNELRVDLAAKTYGDAWDTSWQSHGTATTDMSLAHISHSLNGKQITLTWTDLGITNPMSIDVMKPWESLYTPLGTVNMSTQRYIYTADKNGGYTFRFGSANCKSTTYTLTINSSDEAVTPATKPVITKVPKTGPAENFLVIILLAWLGYIGYVKLYKKTK